MNEEAGFNTALDTNTEDDTARLVFADWLDDRSDPRAPGYRELAKLNSRPVSQAIDWQGKTLQGVAFRSKKYDKGVGPKNQQPCAVLPDAWLSFVKADIYDFQNIGLYWFASRAEAENAAANAFAKITKILNTTFHAIEIRNPTKTQRIEKGAASEVCLTNLKIVQPENGPLRWKVIERIQNVNPDTLRGTLGIRVIENFNRERANFLVKMKKGYDDAGKLCDQLARLEFVSHYTVTQRQIKLITEILNLKG